MGIPSPCQARVFMPVHSTFTCLAISVASWGLGSLVPIPCFSLGSPLTVSQTSAFACSVLTHGALCQGSSGSWALCDPGQGAWKRTVQRVSGRGQPRSSCLELQGRCAVSDPQPTRKSRKCRRKPQRGVDPASPFSPHLTLPPISVSPSGQPLSVLTLAAVSLRSQPS